MRNAQRNAFMTVLRVVRTVATDAGNALVSRNLAQQRWQDRCVADTVIGHFHEISSVDASIPRCTLRHWRRCFAPCFFVFHSPSPSILMPVLSTSRCKPVVVGIAMATCSVFFRLLTEL